MPYSEDAMQKTLNDFMALDSKMMINPSMMREFLIAYEHNKPSSILS